MSALLQDGKLTFRNNGHPGFNVFFVIEDPERSGYQFPDDVDEALSATPLAGPGTECPGQDVSWNQFKPKAVVKSVGHNTTLKVHNPNAKGQECDFGYTLFVTLQSDRRYGSLLGARPNLQQSKRSDKQLEPVKIEVHAVTS